MIDTVEGIDLGESAVNIVSGIGLEVRDVKVDGMAGPARGRPMVGSCPNP